MASGAQGAISARPRRPSLRFARRSGCTEVGPHAAEALARSTACRSGPVRRPCSRRRRAEDPHPLSRAAAASPSSPTSSRTESQCAPSPSRMKTRPRSLRPFAPWGSTLPQHQLSSWAETAHWHVEPRTLTDESPGRDRRGNQLGQVSCRRASGRRHLDHGRRPSRRDAGWARGSRKPARSPRRRWSGPPRRSPV